MNDDNNHVNDNHIYVNDDGNDGDQDICYGNDVADDELTQKAIAGFLRFDFLANYLVYQKY